MNQESRINNLDYFGSRQVTEPKMGQKDSFYKLPLIGGETSPVKVTFLSGLKAWQSRHVDDEGHTEEGLSSSWEDEVV